MPVAAPVVEAPQAPQPAPRPSKEAEKEKKLKEIKVPNLGQIPIFFGIDTIVSSI